MRDIGKALGGGDLRSIGRANAVARYVLRHPSSMGELARALGHRDPVVRARAADALEKVSAREPGWLAPLKATVLRAMTSEQREVRWHVAQMLPRLALSAAQQESAVAWLRQRLDDDSRIVRACALTALSELATNDVSLRAGVTPMLERATRSPVASTRARAKKLLRELSTRWGGGARGR